MALTGFVRSLALEVGQDGITVNTVSPGYVEGERIRWVIAAQAEAQGTTPEEVRANVLAQSRGGQLCRSRECWSDRRFPGRLCLAGHHRDRYQCHGRRLDGLRGDLI